MNASNPTRFFKPQEVAERLGCTVKTLMRYVRAGRIRYISAGLGEQRRRYLFTESDLAEFEEANRRRDVEVTLCPSFSQGLKVLPLRFLVAR